MRTAILISSPEESAVLQKALYERGYRWNPHQESDDKAPRYTNSPVIVVDDYFGERNQLATSSNVELDEVMYTVEQAIKRLKLKAPHQLYDVW